MTESKILPQALQSLSSATPPTPNFTSDEWEKLSRQNKNRRARYACLECRSRKVRCDVTERFPCGNCAWNDAECITRRRRRPKLANLPDLLEVSWAATPATDDKAVEHVIETSVVAGPGRSAEQATWPSPQTTKVQSPSEVFSDLEFTSTLSQAAESNKAATGDWCSKWQSMRPGHHPNDLPPFIKARYHNLDSIDETYLSSKGAFTLPDGQSQKELLQAFLDFTYPYLPILDLDRFLRALGSDAGKDDQISLLLYQSLMFAGTAHVGMDCLARLGFDTRRQARKKFFNIVKLLYTFDCDCDQLATVQALLIMSMWYDEEDCGKGPGHWIDSAISQAFHGGFHRDALLNELAPCDWRTRRRVWWSCFARDRLLSLAWGRPSIIKEEDFDVPRLSEDDFKFEEDTQFGTSGLSLGFWQNQSKRARFIRLYIATVDLCRHLSNTSETYRHSPLAKSTIDAVDFSRILRLDNRCSQQGSDTELLQWHNSLTLSGKSGDSLLHVLKENDPVKLQEVSLELLYYAATSFIYRSRFTFLSDNTLFDPERERVRMCMRYAAWRISDIAASIHKAKMANLLPPTLITSALLGAAVHLVDMDQDQQVAKYQSHEGFSRCLQLLDDMKEVHGAAYVAAGALSWALDGLSERHRMLCPSAGAAEAQLLPGFDLCDEELFSITELFA